MIDIDDPDTSPAHSVQMDDNNTIDDDTIPGKAGSESQIVIDIDDPDASPAHSVQMDDDITTSPSDEQLNRFTELPNNDTDPHTTDPDSVSTDLKIIAKEDPDISQEHTELATHKTDSENGESGSTYTDPDILQTHSITPKQEIEFDPHSEITNNKITTNSDCHHHHNSDADNTIADSSDPESSHAHSTPHSSPHTAPHNSSSDATTAAPSADVDDKDSDQIDIHVIDSTNIEAESELSKDSSETISQWHRIHPTPSSSSSSSSFSHLPTSPPCSPSSHSRHSNQRENSREHDVSINSLLLFL